MLTPSMLRTKIVWSIEDGSLQDTIINTFMLNKHACAIRIIVSGNHHQQLSQFVTNIRTTTNKGIATPIIFDLSNATQGFIDNTQPPRTLNFNDTVTFSAHNVHEGDVILNSSFNWEKTFVPKATLYLSFGSITLTIITTNKNKTTARVIQGGTLLPGMSVQVPQTRHADSYEILTSQRLQSAHTLDYDYLILPAMTATFNKLIQLKQDIISSRKNPPWFLVNINNQASVDAFDRVLQHVEGVVISRRELALDCEPTRIPILCKELIEKCNQHGKLALIASEILGSMRYQPTPTRAEVSDIANAAIDATDAVILPEEVSRGPYGEQALNICAMTIADIEHNNIDMITNWKRKPPTTTTEMEAVTYNALKTAERLKAQAIVCITKMGNTALLLSSYHTKIPIIAVTFSQATKRRLNLIRGVQPLNINVEPSLDKVLPTVSEHLKKNSWLKDSDLIVFVTVSVSSISTQASNLFTIQTL